MTVEDVLKNITCGENVCPINIYITMLEKSILNLSMVIL